MGLLVNFQLTERSGSSSAKYALFTVVIDTGFIDSPVLSSANICETLFYGHRGCMWSDMYALFTHAIQQLFNNAVSTNENI